MGKNVSRVVVWLLLSISAVPMFAQQEFDRHSSIGLAFASNSIELNVDELSYEQTFGVLGYSSIVSSNEVLMGVGPYFSTALLLSVPQPEENPLLPVSFYLEFTGGLGYRFEFDQTKFARIGAGASLLGFSHSEATLIMVGIGGFLDFTWLLNDKMGVSVGLGGTLGLSSLLPPLPPDGEMEFFSIRPYVFFTRVRP